MAVKNSTSLFELHCSYSCLQLHSVVNVPKEASYKTDIL